MYSGTIGKWVVTNSSSPPTQADINAQERMGYEFVTVCAYDSNNNPPDFFAYYRYRGGRHPNSNR